MAKENSMIPRIKLSDLLAEKDRIVTKIKENYNNIKFSHVKREKIKDFDAYVEALVKEQSVLRNKLIKIKTCIQKENLPVYESIFKLSELKLEQSELKYLTDQRYSARLGEINKEIEKLSQELERHNQTMVATFKFQ